MKYKQVTLFDFYMLVIKRYKHVFFGCKNKKNKSQEYVEIVKFVESLKKEFRCCVFQHRPTPCGLYNTTSGF